MTKTMNQKHELNRLNRHSFVVGLASLVVFLFGIGSLILYLDPKIVRIPLGDIGTYQGNLVWLFVAALIMLPGLAFFIVVVWWSQRVKRIYRKQKAVPMQIVIEVMDDSDNTSYYALLHNPDENSDPRNWRALLWLKPASGRDDVGKEFEAQVYFDPRSKKPAVIEYENGILWIMSGSGSVQKLSE